MTAQATTTNDLFGCRSVSGFSRFTEVARFSQGSLLNYTAIGRELGVDRKTVESYFDILDDLLIGYRITPFQKRAKRSLVASSKFYYFDVGVYKSLRPSGPFDRPEEAAGVAIETLVLQHLIAYNAYYDAGFDIHFWRTKEGQEVDFVVYGQKGLYAFEIKHASRITRGDCKALNLFKGDYDIAQCMMIYGGSLKEYHGDISVLPWQDALDYIESIMQ